MKKYRVNYITWGHNHPDSTYDLAPPDSSGPWTLESHDGVLIPGDIPYVIHAYVWSQEVADADNAVYVKLPSKFVGVDVLECLEHYEAVQGRNTALRESNTKLQDSLSEALKRVRIAEEERGNAGQYRHLYEGSQKELLEVASSEQSYKRQVEAQRSIIDGMYKNPLSALARGPAEPANEHINAVLYRVWGLGLVSFATGKTEFLHAFYGCGLTKAAEAVKGWVDPRDSRWDGSERIKFLENQLTQANGARRGAENEAALLRERCNNLQNTLLDVEGRLNKLALSLTNTRQEKPF